MKMDMITRNRMLDSIEDTLGPLDHRDVSKMTVIGLADRYYGPTEDGKKFTEDAMSRLEKVWGIQDAS